MIVFTIAGTAMLLVLMTFPWKCPHCGRRGKPRPVVGSGSHCPRCWGYVP